MSNTKLLFPLLLLLNGIMVVTAQGDMCDPKTEYPMGDQCCNKCQPGTRMLSGSNCKDPICEECRDGEYQDIYTMDDKCKPQPYCDPNKDFEDSVSPNKKEKHICLCKDGFHCTSDECIACGAHSLCELGFGVQTKGDHTTDTVCKKCESGTFSNESSAVDPCRKWTQCEGSVETEGTDRSDNICGSMRSHIIIAVVVIVMILGAASVLLFAVIRHRGRQKKKVTQNSDNLLPVVQPTTQESEKKPEESEDEPGVTENGSHLAQEWGPTDKLSRQESRQDTNQDSYLFSPMLSTQTV